MLDESCAALNVFRHSASGSWSSLFSTSQNQSQSPRPSAVDPSITSPVSHVRCPYTAGRHRSPLLFSKPTTRWNIMGHSQSNHSESVQSGVSWKSAHLAPSSNYSDSCEPFLSLDPMTRSHPLQEPFLPIIHDCRIPCKVSFLGFAPNGLSRKRDVSDRFVSEER